MNDKNAILATLFSVGAGVSWLQDANAILTFTVGLLTLAWWVRRWVNNPKIGPPGKPKILPKLVLLTAGGLLVFSTTGCIAIRQRHNIVSTTETCIGLDLSQRTDGEMPHLRLGYIRTQFHVVPTVRESNQWIYTPPVLNAIAVDGKAAKIEEDFATGRAVEIYGPEQVPKATSKK